LRIAKRLPWSILVILVLAVLFRFIYIGTESLWLDEAVNVLLCEEGWGSIREFCVDDGAHPPLYFILLHLWTLLFGQSEVAVRLPSALMGIIAVFLTCKVGYELYSRRVGLIAGFLLAISSFPVCYSQEVAPYSLLLMLTLLSFFIYIRILKEDKPGKKHLILFALVNVLLCYTHLFGVFTAGAQVLYYILYRRRYAGARNVFWVTQAVTLLVFAPWIYVLITNGILNDTARGLAWIPEPSLSLLNSIARGLAGAGFAGSAWGTFLMWFLIVLCLAGIFYLPGAMRIGQKKKKAKNTERATRISLFAEPETNLILIWLLLPFVMALIISFAYKPILVDRYLIGIVPALYLLAARGIVNIASLIGDGSTRAKATTAVLFIIVAAVTASGLYSYYADYHKLDWRGATAYIGQYAQPGDAIVFYPDYERWPFVYYYGGEPEITIISHRAVLGDTGAVAGNERLWLLQLPLGTEKDVSIQRELFYRFGDEALIGWEIVEPFIIYLFDI